MTDNDDNVSEINLDVAVDTTAASDISARKDVVNGDELKSVKPLIRKSFTRDIKREGPRSVDVSGHYGTHPGSRKADEMKRTHNLSYTDNLFYSDVDRLKVRQSVLSLDGSVRNKSKYNAAYQEQEMITGRLSRSVARMKQSVHYGINTNRNLRTRPRPIHRGDSVKMPNRAKLHGETMHEDILLNSNGLVRGRRDVVKKALTSDSLWASLHKNWSYVSRFESIDGFSPGNDIGASLLHPAYAHMAANGAIFDVTEKEVQFESAWLIASEQQPTRYSTRSNNFMLEYKNNCGLWKSHDAWYENRKRSKVVRRLPKPQRIHPETLSAYIKGDRSEKTFEQISNVRIPEQRAEGLTERDKNNYVAAGLKSADNFNVVQRFVCLYNLLHATIACGGELKLKWKQRPVRAIKSGLDLVLLVEEVENAIYSPFPDNAEYNDILLMSTMGWPPRQPDGLISHPSDSDFVLGSCGCEIEEESLRNTMCFVGECEVPKYSTGVVRRTITTAQVYNTIIKYAEKGKTMRSQMVEGQMISLACSYHENYQSICIPKVSSTYDMFRCTIDRTTEFNVRQTIAEAKIALIGALIPALATKLIWNDIRSFMIVTEHHTTELGGIRSVLRNKRERMKLYTLVSQMTLAEGCINRVVDPFFYEDGDKYLPGKGECYIAAILGAMPQLPSKVVPHSFSAVALDSVIPSGFGEKLDVEGPYVDVLKHTALPHMISCSPGLKSAECAYPIGKDYVECKDAMKFLSKELVTGTKTGGTARGMLIKRKKRVIKSTQDHIKSFSSCNISTENICKKYESKNIGRFVYKSKNIKRTDGKKHFLDSYNAYVSRGTMRSVDRNTGVGSKDDSELSDSTELSTEVVKDIKRKSLEKQKIIDFKVGDIRNEPIENSSDGDLPKLKTLGESFKAWKKAFKIADRHSSGLTVKQAVSDGLGFNLEYDYKRNVAKHMAGPFKLEQCESMTKADIAVNLVNFKSLGWMRTDLDYAKWLWPSYVFKSSKGYIIGPKDFVNLPEGESYYEENKDVLIEYFNNKFLERTYAKNSDAKNRIESCYAGLMLHYASNFCTKAKQEIDNVKNLCSFMYQGVYKAAKRMFFVKGYAELMYYLDKERVGIDVIQNAEIIVSVDEINDVEYQVLCNNPKLRNTLSSGKCDYHEGLLKAGIKWCKNSILGTITDLSSLEDDDKRVYSYDINDDLLGKYCVMLKKGKVKKFVTSCMKSRFVFNSNTLEALFAEAYEKSELQIMISNIETKIIEMFGETSDCEIIENKYEVYGATIRKGPTDEIQGVYDDVEYWKRIMFALVGYLKYCLNNPGKVIDYQNLYEVWDIINGTPSRTKGEIARRIDEASRLAWWRPLAVGGIDLGICYNNGEKPVYICPMFLTALCESGCNEASKKHNTDDAREVLKACMAMRVLCKVGRVSLDVMQSVQKWRLKLKNVYCNELSMWIKFLKLYKGETISHVKYDDVLVNIYKAFSPDAYAKKYTNSEIDRMFRDSVSENATYTTLISDLYLTLMRLKLEHRDKRKGAHAVFEWIKKYGSEKGSKFATSIGNRNLCTVKFTKSTNKTRGRRTQKA